jgi:hypothetical protein
VARGKRAEIGFKKGNRMNQNFYFQPRNFRHELAEKEGCAPRQSCKPNLSCGIGVATGIGLTAGLGIVGGVAGIGGSLASGLGAGSGTTSGTDIVKSPMIQADISGMNSQFNRDNKLNRVDLNQYIKEMMANTPEVGKWTDQEIAAIDPYFNGNMEAQLAALRADSTVASREAVARALADYRGNQNRSLMATGAPGASEYTGRQAITAETNADLASRLQDIAQARNDLGYLSGQKIALAGRRSQLADALAGRAMVGVNARQQLDQTQAGLISALTNMDQQNNIYGTKYTPSTLEKVGSALSSVGSGLGGVGSLLGDMGGGSPGQGGMVASEMSGGASPYNSASIASYKNGSFNQSGIPALNYPSQGGGGLNDIIQGTAFAF